MRFTTKNVQLQDYYYTKAFLGRKKNYTQKMIENRIRNYKTNPSLPNWSSKRAKSDMDAL